MKADLGNMYKVCVEYFSMLTFTSMAKAKLCYYILKI